MCIGGVLVRAPGSGQRGKLEAPAELRPTGSVPQLRGHCADSAESHSTAEQLSSNLRVQYTIMLVGHEPLERSKRCILLRQKDKWILG